MNIVYMDLIIVFIICYLIIGTVAWYRHRISEQVLGAWWDSGADSLEFRSRIEYRVRVRLSGGAQRF